ncbi:MAG: hypothetical protein RSF70_01770 [Ruthenibacterium sp.]
MMILLPHEKDILRTLAQQYMTHAVSAQQQSTQKLWIAHNTGHIERPMVLIDQIPWHEMDVDGSLICQIQDPYWRQIEQNLRRKIYQFEHMPADMVLPPYLLLPHVLQDENYRMFGIATKESTSSADAASDVVSHEYINQFESIQDVDKIKYTDLRADRAKESEIQAFADEIFSGILPVRWQGISLHLGLWDTVSQWVGVEECYYLFADEPELLHAIMEKLTTATLRLIAQGNEEQLFDVTSGSCHCSSIMAKPFDDPMWNRPGISQNAWAFGMAQLFTSVAPAVTQEFEVPYMQRLFEPFGDIYYGCCERLDDRLDIIEQMPHIRKISCSPWSDVDHFAACLPKKYILSNKPNPALVGAGVMDDDAVRKDLLHTINAAKVNQLRLEMILKDNSSVQYQPQRLWNFSRIALECAQM